MGSAGRKQRDFNFTYDREDLIWLAGYLEGEGCFQLREHKRASGDYYYPTIQLTTTDKDVAEHAAEIMGARGPWSRGTPSGCLQQWGVSISGYGITPLLEDLLPLMGKRRQRMIRLLLKTAATKLKTVG